MSMTSGGNSTTAKSSIIEFGASRPSAPVS